MTMSFMEHIFLPLIIVPRKQYCNCDSAQHRPLRSPNPKLLQIKILYKANNRGGTKQRHIKHLLCVFTSA